MVNGRKEWWWRRRRKVYVKHRVFEIHKGVRKAEEVDYDSHIDDGRQVHGIDGKMMDSELSKGWCVRDLNGMDEIWHTVGDTQNESNIGVPFPVDWALDEAKAENDAARKMPYVFMGEKLEGVAISLREMWTMLGEHHTAGWFGRGRFKLLLIIIALEAVGLVILGISGGYFSAQGHSFCYNLQNVQIGNSTAVEQVPALCPATHAATTTGGVGSVSVTVSRTTFSVSTATVIP